MEAEKKEILVTYSSGYGATKEVAEEIAQVLVEQPEFNVNVLSVNDCNGIESYDVIVLGSSVRADRPLANARDFFSSYRHALADKQIALFIVSITAATPEGVDVAKRNYVTQLHDRYPWLKPVNVAAFGGKVDFDKLNPVMQILVKNVMKEKGVNGNGSFDARNWDDIRAWAHELAVQLKNPSSAN